MTWWEFVQLDKHASARLCKAFLTLAQGRKFDSRWSNLEYYVLSSICVFQFFLMTEMKSPTMQRLMCCLRTQTYFRLTTIPSQAKGPGNADIFPTSDSSQKYGVRRQAVAPVCWFYCCCLCLIFTTHQIPTSPLANCTLTIWVVTQYLITFLKAFSKVINMGGTGVWQV